ncbi:hypothetical protein [Mesorhizobium sp. M0488]|uniref:hypothetical protein n=1 Tax=unclassified Mesorhizobium TaxID=325217 RepID=UPI003338C6D1
MSEASKPDKQIGTQFADPIRASSLEWLHQQAGQKTAPDQRAIMSNYLLHRGMPSTEDIVGGNAEGHAQEIDIAQD